MFSSLFRRRKSSSEAPFQVINTELSCFLKLRSHMTHLILLEPGSSHHMSPLRHLQVGPQWPQSGSQGLSLSDSSRHFHCSFGSSVLQAHPHIGLDSPDATPTLPSTPTQHFICPDLVLIHVARCPGHTPSVSFSFRATQSFGAGVSLPSPGNVFAPATRTSLVQGQCSGKICGDAQQLLSEALSCGSPIFAQVTVVPTSLHGNFS